MRSNGRRPQCTAIVPLSSPTPDLTQSPVEEDPALGPSLPSNGVTTAQNGASVPSAASQPHVKRPQLGSSPQTASSHRPLDAMVVTLSALTQPAPPPPAAPAQLDELLLPYLEPLVSLTAGSGVGESDDCPLSDGRSPEGAATEGGEAVAITAEASERLPAAAVDDEVSSAVFDAAEAAAPYSVVAVASGSNIVFTAAAVTSHADAACTRKPDDVLQPPAAKTILASIATATTDYGPPCPDPQRASVPTATRPPFAATASVFSALEGRIAALQASGPHANGQRRQGADDDGDQAGDDDATTEEQQMFLGALMQVQFVYQRQIRRLQREREANDARADAWLVAAAALLQEMAGSSDGGDGSGGVTTCLKHLSPRLVAPSSVSGFDVTFLGGPPSVAAVARVATVGPSPGSVQSYYQPDAAVPLVPAPPSDFLALAPLPMSKPQTHAAAVHPRLVHKRAPAPVAALPAVPHQPPNQDSHHRQASSSSPHHYDHPLLPPMRTFGTPAAELSSKTFDAAVVACAPLQTANVDVREGAAQKPPVVVDAPRQTSPPRAAAATTFDVASTPEDVRNEINSFLRQPSGLLGAGGGALGNTRQRRAPPAPGPIDSFPSTARERRGRPPIPQKPTTAIAAPSGGPQVALVPSPAAVRTTTAPTHGGSGGGATGMSKLGHILEHLDPDRAAFARPSPPVGRGGAPTASSAVSSHSVVSSTSDAAAVAATTTRCLEFDARRSAQEAVGVRRSNNGGGGGHDRQGAGGDGAGSCSGASPFRHTEVPPPRGARVSPPPSHHRDTRPAKPQPHAKPKDGGGPEDVAITQDDPDFHREDGAAKSCAEVITATDALAASSGVEIQPSTHNHRPHHPIAADPSVITASVVALLDSTADGAFARTPLRPPTPPRQRRRAQQPIDGDESATARDTRGADVVVVENSLELPMSVGPLPSGHNSRRRRRSPTPPRSRPPAAIRDDDEEQILDSPESSAARLPPPPKTWEKDGAAEGGHSTEATHRPHGPSKVMPGAAHIAPAGFRYELQEDFVRASRIAGAGDTGGAEPAEARPRSAFAAHFAATTTEYDERRAPVEMDRRQPRRKLPMETPPEFWALTFSSPPS